MHTLEELRGQAGPVGILAEELVAQRTHIERATDTLVAVTGALERIAGALNERPAQRQASSEEGGVVDFALQMALNIGMPMAKAAVENMSPAARAEMGAALGDCLDRLSEVESVPLGELVSRMRSVLREVFGEQEIAFEADAPPEAAEGEAQAELPGTVREEVPQAGQQVQGEDRQETPVTA